MKNYCIKTPLAIVLCLALLLSSSNAFAQRNRRGEERWEGHRGGRYGTHFYRDGKWYRHSWLGFDFLVAALAIGAIIDSLPPRYTTVVVGGVPYYYYDKVYYRPCPQGYVVVPPPVITQPIIVTPAPVIGQPLAQTPDTITVNIPNSKGGYTSIPLRKSNNGYIGPQGEYYSENPTVEQLKTLYGN